MTEAVEPVEFDVDHLNRIKDAAIRYVQLRNSPNPGPGYAFLDQCNEAFDQLARAVGQDVTKSPPD